MDALRSSAFERLFQAHAEPLFAFLVYRTGDRQLAEDLVADTFERALRSRSRFDPRRGSEKSWLYTVAVNLVRDSARRASVETRALARVGAETTACGEVHAESRESQARLRCTACGHAEHADVNAARVIPARAAIGHEDGGRIRPLQRGEPSKRQAGAENREPPGGESGMIPLPAAGNPRASARGGDQRRT
jgi:RNA polymerase sigma factor (sigma-70 family)